MKKNTPTRSGMLLLALVMLGLLTAPGCGPREIPYQEKAIQAGIRVMNSLVFIKSIQESFDEGKKTEAQIFGSGAIISADGKVLTNNHVSEKSTSLKCVLSDKTEVPAKLLGADKDMDIAILQLDMSQVKNPLVVATLGNSDNLKIGDTVLALGAPLGFERSITQGILSCHNRFLEETPESLWLQTDAPINPGNSGGPLINIEGEIIGVNTLGVPAFWGQGIGFAIPINMVKQYKDEMIASGKITRSWTGLQLQALHDFSKSQIIDAQAGVLVAGIDPGSPGEEAGVQSGDILLKVGETDLNGKYQEHIPGLYRHLFSLEQGKATAFIVQRKGKLETLQVTPTEKKKKDGDEFECEAWNLTVKEINRFSNPEISFFKKSGVYILGVKYGGNAFMSGIQDGDVILKLEGKEINNMKAFKDVYDESLKKAKGERLALLEILRFGKERKIIIDYNLMRKAEDLPEG